MKNVLTSCSQAQLSVFPTLNNFSTQSKTVKRMNGRFEQQFSTGGMSKYLSDAIEQARIEERKALGSELHDNVNQLLVSAMLFLGLVKPDESKMKEHKSRAVEYVKIAVGEIRKLSHSMVNSAPALEELDKEITKIIDTITITTDMKVSYEYDPKANLLSDSKKLTFFRIFQEQMKNVLKYSNAKSLKIRIAVTNAKAMLSITDDGVGFDKNVVKEGIGLKNIRSRVEQFNGHMQIISAAGKGCCIKVTIPV